MYDDHLEDDQFENKSGSILSTLIYWCYLLACALLAVTDLVHYIYDSLLTDFQGEDGWMVSLILVIYWQVMIRTSLRSDNGQVFVSICHASFFVS